MTFWGWKKRCRQVEAENARLRESNAQLAARLAEAEAKNRQLVRFVGFQPGTPLNEIIARTAASGE